jgi:hypothetical protein
MFIDPRRERRPFEEEWIDWEEERLLLEEEDFEVIERVDMTVEGMPRVLRSSLEE